MSDQSASVDVVLAGVLPRAGAQVAESLSDEASKSAG